MFKIFILYWNNALTTDVVTIHAYMAKIGSRKDRECLQAWT